MKKLVLMFAAVVAISFASCGNKNANADQAVATDSVATEVEAVVEEVTPDTTAAAVDSAAVVATETVAE